MADGHKVKLSKGQCVQATSLYEELEAVDQEIEDLQAADFLTVRVHRPGRAKQREILFGEDEDWQTIRAGVVAVLGARRAVLTGELTGLGIEEAAVEAADA